MLTATVSSLPGRARWVSLGALATVIVTGTAYYLLLGCGGGQSAAEAARPSQGCELVPGAGPRDVPALYAQRAAPLVLVGSAVYQCGCDSRTLGSATEARRLGGAGEQRKLGSAGEERKLGSAGEERRLGSAGEERKLGSAGEERKLGSAGEERKLGSAGEERKLGSAGEERKLGSAGEERKLGSAGEERKLGSAGEERKLGGSGEERELGSATEEITCVTGGWCPGFLMTGAPPVRYFDGQRLVDVPDRCIR
jgi:hypothetical protein